MKHGTRIILFDPAEEFMIGREVNTRAEFLDSARNKYSITRFTSKKLWPKILPMIMEGGSCILILDEAHKLFPKAKCYPKALDLAAEGRKERISILWITQRPSKLNLELTGNSAGIIIGRLMMKADADRVKEWGVTEIQEFHEFIAVFPGLHPFPIRSIPFS